jgi:hypothetical protein
MLVPVSKAPGFLISSPSVFEMPMEEMGDLYSKLKEDVAFRQEWAERIGLGFELVHNGPQTCWQ